MRPVPWSIFFMLSLLCKSLGSVKMCCTGSQVSKVARFILTCLIKSTKFIPHLLARMQAGPLIMCANSVLCWVKYKNLTVVTSVPWHNA